MPPRALSVCSRHGCPTLVAGGGRCDECKRDADRKRGSGSARGWTSKWARFSRSYLRQTLVCQCTNPDCGHPDGCPAQPTQVDHLDGSGRTGPRAFDPTNLAALCQGCHSRKTVAQDGGFGR